MAVCAQGEKIRDILVARDVKRPYVYIKNASAEMLLWQV